jgi:hypothetical protein
MIKNSFLHEIKAGRYVEAKALIQRMNTNEVYDFLLDLSVEEGSIVLYTFMCSLLLDNESAKLHHYASAIISTALVDFEGSYNAGLFHARRAVKLEPDRIEHKEWLLFFYGIPDKIMSNEEAFFIAKEILQSDPMNKIALKALEDIKWFQSRS